MDAIRDVEAYYYKWANSDRMDCRVVIASTVHDAETLKLLRDIEHQIGIAHWEPFSLFRLSPDLAHETMQVQRATAECVRRLKNKADVCIFWNGRKTDTDAALLAGYLMSALIPVIIMGERVSPLWQSQQLCFCKSTADLQLFLDNFTRYDMPTIEQKLRRAAAVLR